MSDDTLHKSFADFGLIDRRVCRKFQPVFENIPANEKIEFLFNFNIANNLWPNLSLKTTKCSSAAVENRNDGNEMFCKGSNIAALKLYTKSVSLALPNSIELAFAYANRSAVLFRLERYEACLVDINRALAGNYPEDMKPKLIARKRNCASKLKVRNTDKLNYWKSFEQSSRDTDHTLQKYLKYQMKECEFDIDAMDLNYEEKFYLPSVNFRNRKIANASEKLKICFSTEMGRHVVAIEDIKPGEILAVEEPFVSFLMFKNLHSHCSNCFVRCESLIPCNSCTRVMFCSERCRDSAMNRFHRTECTILINAFHMTEIREIDCLVLRLLLVVTKQGEELETLMRHPVYKNPLKNVPGITPKIIDAIDFANIFHLVNHLDERPPGSWDDKCETATLLLYILKSSSFFGTSCTENLSSKLTDKELYVGNLMLRFLLSLSINKFVIDQTSGSHEETHPFEPGTRAEKVGSGIYSLSSLFNHACENNVVNHFHKDANVSYAIKTIEAGEQLFINYGPSYETRDRNERQLWLRAGYFFTCRCPACELNWPSIDVEKFFISLEVVRRDHELRALCRNRRIPLSGYPHSAIIFQFFCDILSSMDKKKMKKPNFDYRFWQRRIVLFISARANYYEVSRDHVLLSL